MLPEEFWKEEKTLGYFEKPEVVTDIISLGAGRYGFKSKDGYQITKRRGIDSVDSFNWHELLNKATSNTVTMTTRALISVGMVLGNHEYTFKDLGRIVESDREVDLVVGLTKRPLKEELKLDKLKTQLVETESFVIPKYMLGDNDMSLPNLRSEMFKRPYKLKKEKRKEYSRKTSKNHYRANKEQINAKRRKQYRNKKMGIS